MNISRCSAAAGKKQSQSMHSGAIGYDLTRKMVQEFCVRISHIHAPLELEQSMILKISVQNRKISAYDCSSPDFQPAEIQNTPHKPKIRFWCF